MMPTRPIGCPLHRASSHQAQESLQARVTVLEGRVRFLENSVRAEAQQQQQQQRPQQQPHEAASYAPSTSSLQQSQSSPLRRPSSNSRLAASPPAMRPTASRRLGSAPQAASMHGHAASSLTAPDVWHLRASADTQPSAAWARHDPAQGSSRRDQPMYQRQEAHSALGQLQGQDTSAGVRVPAAHIAASSRATAVAAGADAAAAARSTRHLQYQSTEELISSLATRYSEAQRVLLDYKAPQRS